MCSVGGATTRPDPAAAAPLLAWRLTRYTAMKTATAMRVPLLCETLRWLRHVALISGYRTPTGAAIATLRRRARPHAEIRPLEERRPRRPGSLVTHTPTRADATTARVDSVQRKADGS